MDHVLEEIRRAGHGTGAQLSALPAGIVEERLDEVLKAIVAGIKGDFSGNDLYFLKDVSIRLISLVHVASLSQASKEIDEIGQALASLRVPRTNAMGASNADVIARNASKGYNELAKTILPHVDDQAQSSLIDTLTKILKAVESSRYLEDLVLDVVSASSLAPKAASKLNGDFVALLKKSRTTQSVVIAALSNTIEGNPAPIVDNLSQIMNVVYYEPKILPMARGIFEYLCKSDSEQLKNVMPTFLRLVVSSSGQVHAFESLSIIAAFPAAKEHLNPILSKIERAPSDFASKNALSSVTKFLVSFAKISKDDAVRALKLSHSLAKYVYSNQALHVLQAFWDIYCLYPNDGDLIDPYFTFITSFQKDRDSEIARLVHLIIAKKSGKLDDLMKAEEEKKQKDQLKRNEVVSKFLEKGSDTLLPMSKLLGIDYVTSTRKTFSVIEAVLNSGEEKKQHAPVSPAATPSTPASVEVVPIVETPIAVEAPAALEVVAPVEAPADANAAAHVEGPADAEVVAPVEAPADVGVVAPEAPADVEAVVPVDAPVEAPADVEVVAPEAPADVEAVAPVDAPIEAVAPVEAQADIEAQAGGVDPPAE